MVETKSRLNGDDLRAMFLAATALMESNVEAINALNVFPVPDGDTGTNMFLTLRSVVDRIDPMEKASAGDVAAAMAQGALMGARGNSGVILSQFFRGLAIGLEGASDFGAEELVSAYREAREHAYQAVGDPVEGTMLTVIRSVAEAAEASLDGPATVQDVCEVVSAAARDSVARTPMMLSVLRDAGVVDAGGQGLAVLLEGVRRSVEGEVSDLGEIAPPKAVGIEGPTGLVSTEFLAATNEEIYGYCTQFLIQGDGLNVDVIRDTMREMARSTVVVGDEAMVNIHVHAEDPGPIVSLGVSHGTLNQVKIENMDAQHGEFSDARWRDTVPAASVAGVGVVAVAWGKGLEKLFTSLGASEIVAGGDTMNPSVQELIAAVERESSDSVLLLPNNGNIVPAATQAADNSDKIVKVVPSRSIPQGISAILAFNAEQDLATNAKEMEGALAAVRTAGVTIAEWSATVKGANVEPGQLIGMIERELVASGDDLSQVVVCVLREAEVSAGELVTLYWGDPIIVDEADLVVREVASAFEGVEIELVYGGQPHYHFIISIE